MNKKKPVIALLIDADNFSHKAIEPVIVRLESYGNLTIKKAFGNWKKPHLQAWEEASIEWSIRAVQQFDVAKGKNATDIAITIDAMELLFTEQVDVFALASSDADFAPLVMRLREANKVVLGFGEQKAPKSLVNAYTEFFPNHEIAANQQAATDDSKRDEQKQTQIAPSEANDRLLTQLLAQSIALTAEENGWFKLNSVASRLVSEKQFDKSDYGFKKVTDLLKSLDMVEAVVRGDMWFIRIRVNGE